MTSRIPFSSFSLNSLGFDTLTDSSIPIFGNVQIFPYHCILPLSPISNLSATAFCPITYFMILTLNENNICRTKEMQ